MCIINFNIDTDWSLTHSYSYQNSRADKETIESFKEKFDFEYKFINGDININYKHVD